MEINQITNIIKIYADIADEIGDYKTADECHALLKEASEFNNNIRTAAIKTAFFKKLFRGISNIGKNIDRTVRKMIPGGWMTVITAVGASYLAKLPMNMKGVGGKVLDYVKQGKNPMDLLKNANPMVQKAAQMLISQAKNTPNFAAASPTVGEQQAAGMQSGTSSTMQGFLPIQGFTPSTQPQYSYETSIYNAFNNLRNKLKSNTATQADITNYKTQTQNIINQIVKERGPANTRQLSEAESTLPVYTQLLKQEFPNFSQYL